MASPLAQVSAHLNREPVVHGENRSLRQLAAGPDQGFPHGVVIVDPEQQNLGRSTGVPAGAQPGGQHTGVVDHQHVAGPQQRWQVADGSVLHMIADSVEQSG